MDSYLVKAEHLRHGQRFLRELQAFGWLAANRPPARGGAENTRRDRGLSVAGELLGPLQVGHGVVAAASVPPDVREEDLGFACRLVTHREQGVSRFFESVGVEGEGAVASCTESEASRGDQVDGLEPGCRRELERRAPMVGQKLSAVLGSTERLDPESDLSVLYCATCACDLAVRDVAYESVRERELVLALE